MCTKKPPAQVKTCSKPINAQKHNAVFRCRTFIHLFFLIVASLSQCVHNTRPLCNKCQTARVSELVKVKKCKSWRKGGWGGADRDVGRQPQQRDLVLLIGQGQTEGRAVSSLLISSDRLTPQHPLGCPILCIYCCSCRAAKRKDWADRWPKL